jgi:hypothetical protein
MKKKAIITALVMAAIMVFSSHVVLYADEVGLPTYEISVDPYDISDVERVIDLYELPPETAAGMIEFAEQCQSGDIEGGSMTLETHYNPRTRAIREYTGYNGLQYREETVQYGKNSSAMQLIYTSSGAAFAAYASGVINSTITTVTQTAIDTATQGIPLSGLIAGLVPPAYSSSPEIKHQADLFSQRTVKHTYLNDNGQYHYPAQTETMSYHFENRVSVPSADRSYNGADTPRYIKYTPNYISGSDQKAYQYMLTGYIEHFNSVTYRNAIFDF